MEREQKVIVGLLLEVNHNHHHDDNEILKNKISAMCKKNLFSLQFCRLKEVGYTAEDVNR